MVDLFSSSLPWQMLAFARWQHGAGELNINIRKCSSFCWFTINGCLSACPSCCHTYSFGIYYYILLSDYDVARFHKKISHTNLPASSHTRSYVISLFMSISSYFVIHFGFKCTVFIVVQFGNIVLLRECTVML
jgi:hypothetical protein